MLKIIRSTYHIIIKWVFAGYPKSKAFQKCARCYRKPRESIFNHSDVRRWRFFHDFEGFSWKLLQNHQKLDSSKHDGLSWSARKNFSNDFGIQILLLKTCLGPWVPAELNGVPVRRVNPFLLHQTCGGGDFLDFKLPESHFRGFSSQNSNFERFFEVQILKEWWK